MNYPKYFPLPLHIVLAALAIGAAGGAEAEHLRPIILYPLAGIAAGLAITAWVRLMDS